MERDIDTLELMPAYTDVMTLENFTDACLVGAFTDDDGVGYYATETMMSRRIAAPSDVRNGIICKAYTHIAWFNK